MNYENFINEITEIVRKKVEDGFKVHLNHVLKNNGIELDALVIRKDEQEISPNIYLEYYYNRFCEGVSMDEIADEIFSFYLQTMKQQHLPEENLHLDFQFSKNKIFYQVVHYEKNKKLLEDIPHVLYLDLAIIFRCFVSEDENGMQSYCINNKILEYWGISQSELYKIASQNTPVLFPPKISSMQNVLEHVWDIDMEKKTEEIGEENYDDFLKKELRILDNPDEMQMYVITNQKGVNGAGAFLYPDLLWRFSKKCESNLFLLPSSIHEFIVLPENNYNKEELEEMVRNVNDTQVAADEFLSNRVYYFDRAVRQIV